MKLQIAFLLSAIVVSSHSSANCQEANSLTTNASSATTQSQNSSKTTEGTLALSTENEDNSLAVKRPKVEKMAVITRRIAKLQRIIALASEQGALPDATRDEMNKDLKDIANQQEIASTMTDQSCHSKIMGLARALDDVSYKLNITLHENVVNPLILNGKLRHHHKKAKEAGADQQTQTSN